MQNLLEIQNALRSAPDQQLMALMQGANPTVPQWAVASELNNRKEMRDEQTRQQGLGQPTVLQQLTGAASASTPQTNVAGMPQGVASGMAQSMAPKTDVAQNTGIASVAPVATMASGGILKMATAGEVRTFKNKATIGPSVLLNIEANSEDSDAYAEMLLKHAATFGKVPLWDEHLLLPVDGDSMQKYKVAWNKAFSKTHNRDATEKTDFANQVRKISEKVGENLETVRKFVLGRGFADTLSKTEIDETVADFKKAKFKKEAAADTGYDADEDMRVPKYVPSASDLYDTESGRFKSENATPENYVVSAGLSPVGGAMYSSPTGARGGSTDSSGLGLPTDEFSQTSLSAMSRPKGLATLGAAGDADMLDETVGVQTAPIAPSSPGIAAGTPFDTTKYTPRLPETPAKAIQTGVDDKGRGIFIPSLEKTQLDDLRGRSGVGAFSKVPFNATSDEAAKKSVSQATLANNARDERVARVTSDGPGTELAVAAKTDPMQMTDTEIRNASQGLIPYDMSMAADGAQDPKPITIDSAVKPSAEVTNAQLEAFTDAAALRNTALTVPTKPKKPEVFDPLKGLFMYQALADDAPTDDSNYDAKTIIKRINELKTPEEKAATLTMLNNRFIDAEKKVTSLEERLQRARIAKQSGTGDYNYDVEAGVGRFGAGELAATLNKELIAAKDDFNLLYKNIGRIVPASGFGGDFAAERYFGKDTVSALNKLKADDLQAEAVADVVKVTANENYPVSPVEVRKRLRAMEEKDADADERFDLAEARLDAERAEGLTAGENAFVVPSETKPFVPLYGSKFAENSAFLNDEADYDGSSMDGLNTDGPFMPKEDTRITRMKVLADKISSGELTPTALEFAKKDLARLSAAVERTGGQDTIEKYFSNQIIGPALRGAEKYGVKGIDFAVNNLGLGNLASQAVSPEFAGRISDYTSENAKLADDMQIAADTSPAEIQSNAILDAMITNDAQTKAGSAAQVDNSLGALITDGKAQIEAVPGQILTPELNNKLAAELATTLENRTEEISKDGALINKMWGESEFQPETNVESQIVNAKGLTAAEQLDADRAAGLTAGENAFVASTKQDAGGSGKGKSTGIATINPMANRASDSPSSYEQKLLDILAEREKSADQDKWLGLAEMGMRLMASSNPNMLSAIGEAGLGASQTFLGNKRKAEAQEMDILTKLSALESRKQIADDANRTRLEAANISASSKPPRGPASSVLTSLDKDVKLLEERRPPTPKPGSSSIDAQAYESWEKAYSAAIAKRDAYRGDSSLFTGVSGVSNDIPFNAK